MSKINWSIAALMYSADPTQSYESIAKEFGVSKSAVSSRARKEGWQRMRSGTDIKVIQELPEKAAESRAEVIARHVKTAKKLQQMGLEALERFGAPVDLAEARRFIATGIQIEQSAYKIDEPIIQEHPNKPYELAQEINALPKAERDEIVGELKRQVEEAYPGLSLEEALSQARKDALEVDNLVTAKF